MRVNKEQIGEEEGQTASADRPGEILKRAREARGMTLADVAEHTRIATRQLEAVERNDFASLPGTPYAVGFSRAYARAVGVDEVAIASAVRAELGTSEPGGRYEMFEPTDPARIPPRWIAWIAALLAILLAIGYGVWRSQLSSPPTDAELSTKAEKPAAANIIGSPIAPSTPDSTVVLTAISDVWLRIYDQNGERLLEKKMAKGESYAVPATAQNPMLLTGRPDALAVTVNGQQVPPLGPPEKTLTDFPISAAALLARPASQGTADNVAGPAPSNAQARPAIRPRSESPETTETTPAPTSPPSPEPAATPAPPSPTP